MREILEDFLLHVFHRHCPVFLQAPYHNGLNGHTCWLQHLCFLSSRHMSLFQVPTWGYQRFDMLIVLNLNINMLYSLLYICVSILQKFRIQVHKSHKQFCLEIFFVHKSFVCIHRRDDFNDVRKDFVNTCCLFHLISFYFQMSALTFVQRKKEQTTHVDI